MIPSSWSARRTGSYGDDPISAKRGNHRPLEQVFAFVSDLENAPQWTPGAVMRRTSQGQLGVGTTFQQRDRFMGRRMDLSLEVTDYEPPHRIGLRTISGQLSFGGTRMFEPVGEAATRVTFVGEGHAPGMLKLAEPLLTAAGERRLRAQLGNLKRLLEAQAQG
jgi:uncharacterized protein YndB with AHSA1/START domain